MSTPAIRRRTPKSQRRKDGLIQYAKDITSQNGEDGIIEAIFQRIPPSNTNTTNTTRYCVDVGAWDGKHLSNTHSLLTPPDSCWQGVLIEADPHRIHDLKQLHEPLGNLCIHSTVSSNVNSENSLLYILQHRANHVPKDFDFLSIDVDGSDYWLLHDIWNPPTSKEQTYRPKVVCIEANPTMPNDLIYIPPRNDTIRHGSSLAALVELAEQNDYVLIETTIYNAFFVPQEIYTKHFSELVPDTSIEALREMTMGTSIYQLYDGTLKLWGCKKMLWHNMPMDEAKLQVLPPQKRSFPFAPQTSSMAESAFFKSTSIVVDMSAYCKDSSSQQQGNEKEESQEAAAVKRECASEIVRQLKYDGFVLVKGTGMSQQVCQDALDNTHAFLQEADESVRRSCLTKDRARRGYSPMCTENFASLIGEDGPNDLVRKFRIGPTTIAEIGAQTERTEEISAASSGTPSSSPLHSPNVWPSSEVWDEHSSTAFRNATETYYERICKVSHSIVQAICHGIMFEEHQSNPDQQSTLSSLQAIASKDISDHTSILTLLGYRKGTRHKKTQKKRHVHPLVAAHTDVGVITVLLFDGGNSALLQRKSSPTNENNDEDQWTNVTLPPMVPEDPIFVVNIADCLSELSNNCLPSTLHRVMPGSGVSPRNCLALFVGLQPQEMLHFHHDHDNGQQDGTIMTYEEWRKRRIAKSQAVLESNKK
ncbi:unnamed protein product [Cylindrotheca closterium]|uniref:Fe2OG dioxygenase domain-containing protein n=1 Tax=Cylindrotheca closterium TaxID=2856 RepID=A0AAD2G6U6_9STRA|nr:unnamed protein product [Cylindrotheca closterium]